MRQGPIKLNAHGRFEFDGFEITSGDVFEMEFFYLGQPVWIKCRAEFAQELKKYIFVHAEGSFVPVDGTCREIWP